MACANKNDLFDFPITGFLWDDLRIVCTSDQVHEEQFVSRAFNKQYGPFILPDAKGRLAASKEPYQLQIENKYKENYGRYFAINSDTQPATNAYFTGDKKSRTIYVQFPGYPIICRIYFAGEGNNPCSSDEDKDVKDYDNVCYYEPGADTEPTPAELEAEMVEVMKDKTSPGSAVYVSNIKKPVVPFTDQIVPNVLPETHPAKPDAEKKPTVVNPLRNQKKFGVLKTVGIVVVVLLLLALLGGVAFYFIRTTRSDQSSAGRFRSAANIEAGNDKSSAASESNQSEQPLADDAEHGIRKPSVELQAPPETKRQRAGANLAFNGDI